MTDICYDWFNLTEQQLKWLIGLYDWAVFPIPDAYAISGRLQFVKQLSLLDLVECHHLPTTGGNRLVRITEHGKRYLENVYPVELILKLLVRISQRDDSRAQVVRDGISGIIKRLPLGFAPIFLAHRDSTMREIGKTIVDRAN